MVVAWLGCAGSGILMASYTEYTLSLTSDNTRPWCGFMEYSWSWPGWAVLEARSWWPAIQNILSDPNNCSLTEETTVHGYLYLKRYMTSTYCNIQYSTLSERALMNTYCMSGYFWWPLTGCILWPLTWCILWPMTQWYIDLQSTLFLSSIFSLDESGVIL